MKTNLPTSNTSPSPVLAQHQPELSTHPSWDFSLPADGWFQLTPLGEFPCIDQRTGDQFMQVVDALAIRLLKSNFDQQASDPNFSGVLIDFDHFSEDTNKPSEAAGWITALETREDGLWFQARWSSVGRSNLLGGIYRHISPVWLAESIGKNRGRPTALKSAALTNDPNIKGMVPLSNRANSQLEKSKMDKEKLIKALGLSADASESQIESAIAKLKNRTESAESEAATCKNRAETAESELATAKAAALEAEAESFLETHSSLIKNRADIKAQFIKDPDGTKAIFANLSESTHTTLHNRKSTDPSNLTDNKKISKTDQFEALVQQYKAANRCTYSHAFDEVKRTCGHLLTNNE